MTTPSLVEWNPRYPNVRTMLPGVRAALSVDLANEGRYAFTVVECEQYTDAFGRTYYEVLVKTDADNSASPVTGDLIFRSYDTVFIHRDSLPIIDNHARQES